MRIEKEDYVWNKNIETYEYSWKSWEHSCGGKDFEDWGIKDHYIQNIRHIYCVKCKKEIYFDEGVVSGKYASMRLC